MKLPWEAKAAKRELAEAALRRALECIEGTRVTGGSATAYTSTWYVRALYLIRHAEDLLRQSESR